jgi:hypothetical protein
MVLGWEEAADLTRATKGSVSRKFPPKENLQATLLEMATGQRNKEENHTSSDDSSDDPNNEDYKDKNDSLSPHSLVIVALYCYLNWLGQQVR